jgi:nucleoid-associated protein YgaU
MNALIDIAIGSGAVGAGVGLFEAGLWVKARLSGTPAEHAELLEHAPLRSVRAPERVVERPASAQPVDQHSSQEAPPARAGARR